MTASRSRKLLVLVVDDNDNNRTVLGQMVTSLGGRVLFAENGAGALEAAGAQAFDLVLMDIAMPVMDGLQATRQLRRDGMVCPIVAVTAHGRRYGRDSLAEVGFDDLIDKPVATARIARALDLARATQLG